ncbi:MAG: hypothetical protein GY797_16820, partial [Deltaproteobacteria bacterium]|nr:hypothetical protein [Deltaproteobacteria bacterium]
MGGKLCTEAIERLKDLSPEAHDGLHRLINATDETKVAEIFADDEILNAAFFSTFEGVDVNQLKGLISNVDGD